VNPERILLELSYRWNRYVFAVGAENLFDRFPDRNLYRNANGALTAQINNGVSAYPINTQFGMNGRYVYTRVSYTF
jgi:iron complex outermembrane receptor protein